MQQETGPELWIVDRVDGGIVVLIEEDSEVVVTVSAELLGELAVEGAVLSVPVGGVGEPLWENAVRDSAAENEFRREAEARVERLAERDPGGDVAL